MAMFISLRSKKRKMASSSGFEESTLEELAKVLFSLTGRARDYLARAW